MKNDQGILLVVSGPAGVGKGTLCRELMAQAGDLEYSVSVTTRAPRPKEQEGREYYFRSREEFERMIEGRELLEWAEFCGNYYGTPLFHVQKVLAEGRTILLEIDIQGAKQVKQVFPQGVFIFIAPPSFETLSERLHKRGTEPEEVIQKRLKTAEGELRQIQAYDYIVENDRIDLAVEKLRSIIIAEGCRVKNNLIV
nr:guanylate kinase [Syntrophobotulus glycolicus]